MARPRNDSGQVPVEQRLEEAFWDLIQTCPIDRITARALTERAQCNRGTFYYYFDDVYDLLDRVIQKNVPLDIAPALITYMLEGLSGEGGQLTASPSAAQAVRARLLEVARSERGRLDKLCILLNSDAAPLVTRKLKAAAMEVWSGALGLEVSALPATVRIVFEFLVGGIMGLLAYRAESNLSIQMEDALGVLMPEMPQAFMACFHKGLGPQM